MSSDNSYYCLDMTGSVTPISIQYRLEKDDYGFNKSNNINLEKIYILHDEHINFYLTHLNNRDINLLTRMLHTVKHKWSEEYRSMFDEKHHVDQIITIRSVAVNDGVTYVIYDEDDFNFKGFRVNKIIRENGIEFATDYIIEPTSVDINKDGKFDLIDTIDEKTMAHLLAGVNNKLAHKVDIGNLINYRTNEGLKKLMVIGFDNERIYMIDRDTFFDKKNFYIINKNTNFQVVGTVSKNELKNFLDFYFEHYNELSFDTNMYCMRIENCIEEAYKTL
jgi:hypothetical protein